MTQPVHIQERERRQSSAQPPLTIDIYSVCFNEAFFLPYFLAHYETFARHIIVYDNHSTDDSVNLLRAHQKVKVIEKFGQPDIFEENDLTALRNGCWKGSDADWVIVCDIDELIFAEELEGLLRDTTAPIIKPQGLDLVREALPPVGVQIVDCISEGLTSDAFSKPILFQPKRLRETGFSPGSHQADPESVDGRKWHIAMGDPCHPSIKLLHCRFVGFDQAIRKRMEQFERAKRAKGYRPPRFTYDEWRQHIFAGYVHPPFRRRVSIRGAQNIKWYTSIVHDAAEADFVALEAALQSCFSHTDFIPIVVCDQPCAQLEELWKKYHFQIVYPREHTNCLVGLPVRVRDCLQRLAVPLLAPGEEIVLSTDCYVVFNQGDSGGLRALAQEAGTAVWLTTAPGPRYEGLLDSAVCLLGVGKLLEFSTNQIDWVAAHWRSWSGADLLGELYARLPADARGCLPPEYHWHCLAPVNPAAKLINVRPGTTLRRSEYSGCRTVSALLDRLPAVALPKHTSANLAILNVSYEQFPLVDAEWLDDELLLVNGQDQTMKVLNASAAILWEALTEFPCARDLAGLLCEAKPDLPYAEAFSQCCGLLDNLCAGGFITPRLAPRPGWTPAYREVPEVDAEVDGDQATLVHTRTLETRVLDANALLLWQALPWAESVDDLASFLQVERPDLDADSASTQVRDFVADLHAAEFIRPAAEYVVSDDVGGERSGVST